MRRTGYSLKTDQNTQGRLIATITEFDARAPRIKKGTSVIPVPRGREKRSGGETAPQATWEGGCCLREGGRGREKGGREGSSVCRMEPGCRIEPAEDQ